MNPTLLIGWTTLADLKAAEKLAEAMIEQDLAACVQIEPGLRSIYRWEGRIQNDAEVRLTIKFLESKREALEKFIQEEHPYETPEWIVVRPEFVDPHYLKWAEDL